MDDFIPVSPLNFFQIQVDCYRCEMERKHPFLSKPIPEKFFLPDTSSLSTEDTFAKVALGWHPDGMACTVVVQEPFTEADYPNIQHGDSIELFLDTRDMKNAGFNTRFCHHFFFLPKSVDEVSCGEITRFRTEDAHELCDSNELKMKADFTSKDYTIYIFIPRQCLYGYDPEQFDRLGFTYRINRPKRPSQHFSVLSDEYQIDQQPALWGSLRLINAKNSSK
ncbi:MULTISPECIES: hypothetical protein [Parachlamydia]|uniref:Carbohydrate-binding domain-containing protein n=2 Tax=Parachlamydia acanthamoebae TaxID=83552 RepID=F8KVQ2_PARAV|nr:hypothetical protein [Parachlamydia acanthamoebae]EFB42194.1 hypothetical protein pah_c014o130 [Parachlamydia acanthamoebae str. Hall's coccus]KIA76391.1 hypothetical protein DB43_AK00510 [Parachlamydia acanthamoebae]CCB85188.1 putative uncharacterized protein [Parachlamydia acanthamoebae UV-7]